MIEQIGIALIVYDAGVIGKAPALGRHQRPAILPRAGRTLAHGVAQVFRDGSTCPQQVIPLVVPIEPRAFLVTGRTFFYVALTLAESLFRHGNAHDVPRIGYHVLVQLHIIAERITPIEIGLSVLVYHHGRVDIATATAHQRLAQWVIERAIRTIGHSHANSAASTLLGHGHIGIKFAVTLYTLHGPCVALRPVKGFQRQHHAMVCPVHHVGGGIKLPVIHHEPSRVILVMAGVKEKPISGNHGCRVGGVHRLHDGILRHARQWRHGQQTT